MQNIYIYISGSHHKTQTGYPWAHQGQNNPKQWCTVKAVMHCREERHAKNYNFTDKTNLMFLPIEIL